MRLLFSLLISLLIFTGCATYNSSSAGKYSTATEVETEVREPASKESEGIQVKPLQNPAVKQLLASATASESAGQLEQASQMLERGLRIAPRDPELLQRMAEIRLQQKIWQQAINFAARSFDMGAQLGELCARNWRTIAVANKHLQEASAAADARAQIDACMRKRPQKY